MAVHRSRPRNSERTRRAVLDAAEVLFADQGYARTSLVDVGRCAGVSRGTPGYFFGSKAELYRAVLDRCFQQVREAVRAGRAKAASAGAPVDAILAGAVSDYLHFLAAHPRFVRLIEREALDAGEAPLDIPPRLAAGQEALAAIVDELGIGQERTTAAHLLLSLIALCWFPLVHTTLVRSLGLDPAAPTFADERRRHVIDLILHGFRSWPEAGTEVALHASTGVLT